MNLTLKSSPPKPNTLASLFLRLLASYFLCRYLILFAKHGKASGLYKTVRGYISNWDLKMGSPHFWTPTLAYPIMLPDFTNKYIIVLIYCNASFLTVST